MVHWDDDRNIFSAYMHSKGHLMMRDDTAAVSSFCILD